MYDKSLVELYTELESGGSWFQLWAPDRFLSCKSDIHTRNFSWPQAAKPLSCEDISRGRVMLKLFLLSIQCEAEQLLMDESDHFSIF